MYGPSISSNLATTAKILAVVFVQRASETLLILRPEGVDRLHFEVLTRFTDQTNRSGVIDTGTLARVPKSKE